MSSATVDASSFSSTIDVNHPYYLHPSDNPGMVLITVKLNYHNYDQWCKAMEIALSFKLKLGFVNGTSVPPDDTSSLYVYWNRCNYFVISWILNTVSSEIRQFLSSSGTAEALWFIIKLVIDENDVPQIGNLRKKLANLTEDNLGSFDIIFYDIRALNDEIDVLTESKCTCKTWKCNVYAHQGKFTRETRLSHLLMGLSDKYSGHPINLSAFRYIPTLHEVYSSIIRGERYEDRLANEDIEFNEGTNGLAVDSVLHGDRQGIEDIQPAPRSTIREPPTQSNGEMRTAHEYNHQGIEYIREAAPTPIYGEVRTAHEYNNLQGIEYIRGAAPTPYREVQPAHEYKNQHGMEYIREAAPTPSYREVQPAHEYKNQQGIEYIRGPAKTPFRADV